MEEGPDSSIQVLRESSADKENVSSYEPPTKKMKVTDVSAEGKHKLEDRLSGILCCAVCLDLPTSCYQCSNGHLMCAGCFNHLLADARIKDETATCPNCRCEINRNVCIRNLAVEKAVSELPSDCAFCNQKLPRYQLEYHQREMCQERPCSCRYSRIGCHWEGPFHEVAEHESGCAHPMKTGEEVMAALEVLDAQRQEEQKLYNDIFSLLSFEKITFNDLQLKPFRTDDFITRLYYETSRFTAFNQQWVIRAKINSDHKNPTHTMTRSLSYQLVVKSKLTAPMVMHFLALSGPFGGIKMKSKIYNFEFTPDIAETEYLDLPIDSAECNKLLASKTINFRIVMFQVTK
ncbi:zinc finger TRAF-type-containing protein 1-like [Physella acuta]|uniref:zinc finger TRAF-type-containing protein 1-like n=1 Tax=Physella acuta TaxID=109671 RepID=UPI0027DAFFC8|nr:zinc finger TRAF-type-containing protein 1-like [Physella acuta]